MENSNSNQHYSSLTKEQSQLLSIIFAINENISEIISTSINENVSSAFSLED